MDESYYEIMEHRKDGFSSSLSLNVLFEDDKDDSP